MAVYTKLEREDVERVVAHYFSNATLVDFTAISAGIENSNYFVNVSTIDGLQKYVLTLFENISVDELPFFQSLTSLLSLEGYPVPAPRKALDDTYDFELRGKPAVLVPCLDGRSYDSPNLKQCMGVAQFLAGMHVSQSQLSVRRKLVRDIEWLETRLELLKSSEMSATDLSLLDSSIERYKQFEKKLLACPQGIVHGDLFRDNALFVGDKLSGVIDFYHACEASLLFDLAVMVNDWAWDSSLNHYDSKRMRVIVETYQATRAWTKDELELWPFCLELAALRFWVSRLASLYLESYQANALEGTPIKDPDEMKWRVLAARTL